VTNLVTDEADRSAGVADVSLDVASDRGALKLCVLVPAHRLAAELSGQWRQRAVATNERSDIEEPMPKSQNYREAV
jgi:hypothetical protein